MITLISPWTTELQLIATALQLGAISAGGPLSPNESRLADLSIASGWSAPPEVLRQLKESIRDGDDPLGEGLTAVRTPEARRHLGQVLTPPALVGPMVEWVAEERPVRVVDAGAGTGRFVTALAEQIPAADIIAVETDPVATLLLRANVGVRGLNRVRVQQADFTKLHLPAIDGATAFIGNPPYVRHHQLPPDLKSWARSAAHELEVSVSGLAGLHAYFFLATAKLACAGDVGCFVTSAEWLDVNYGQVVRDLLLDGLGGESIHLVDPSATPFADVATTAAVSCFRVGSRPTSVRFRRVHDLAALSPLRGGRQISRTRLEETRRWSLLTRARVEIPEGYVELGELCRVHRGAVTGSNRIWVVGADEDVQLPEHVLFPSVTRARELFAAQEHLASRDRLRRVIDLPEDLDELGRNDRRQVEHFLDRAKALGAADGYIARHRRAWWSVGLREPAPILASYMARRPPAFVRNLAHARHINIAHGLYPREPLPERALDRLAHALRTQIRVHQGRTYAGGLTKFEPKEMERLLVPDLPLLMQE